MAHVKNAVVLTLLLFTIVHSLSKLREDEEMDIIGDVINRGKNHPIKASLPRSAKPSLPRTAKPSLLQPAKSSRLPRCKPPGRQSPVQFGQMQVPRCDHGLQPILRQQHSGILSPCQQPSGRTSQRQQNHRLTNSEMKEVVKIVGALTRSKKYAAKKPQKTEIKDIVEIMRKCKRTSCDIEDVNKVRAFCLKHMAAYVLIAEIQGKGEESNNKPGRKYVVIKRNKRRNRRGKGKLRLTSED